MQDTIRFKFEDLVTQLSPENLSCNGELTIRQIAARKSSISAQWHRLERELGRRVPISEIKQGMTQ